MKFHPYSIEHAPRSLPIWQTIIEDLGNPHPKRIAKVLGIGVRTVYRYHRENQAPRSVALALFWLTRWGRSQVYTQAVNDCQMAVSYANALEAELNRTRVHLEHVLALSDSGAANAPLIGDSHVSSR